MGKDKKQSNTQSNRKTIVIACEGKTTLPLDAIEEFQGDLKRRTKQDVEKIQQSILKYGFTAPFFVWNGTGHNYCLDGHGRIKALDGLRQQGYELPMFPVVFVNAKNETEAKQKLLLINSRYGNITQSGLEAFISVEDVDFSVMNFTVDKKAMAEAFQNDSTIADTAVTFPVTVALNKEEYENLKALKEKWKIKKDKKLVQELIERMLQYD